MSERKQQERPDFLSAKQQWMERYGSYIAQAKNWRLAAFSAFGVAGIAVASCCWLASQSHVVPYVVQVDALGNSVHVAQEIQDGALNQPIITHVIANWVVEARERIYDNQAESIVSKDTYNYVTQNEAPILSQYFQQNNPFSAKQDGDVTVTISTCLPMGKLTDTGGTYQVTWTEKTYDPSGNNLATVQNYSAIITYVLDKKVPEEQLINNPFGIYITNFQWQKTI